MLNKGTLNRRDFLRFGSMVAGAALLTACPAPAAPGAAAPAAGGAAPAAQVPTNWRSSPGGPLVVR